MIRYKAVQVAWPRTKSGPLPAQAAGASESRQELPFLSALSIEEWLQVGGRGQPVRKDAYDTARQLAG